MSNITMEEVEKHNTINDCWIVSHGKVYDVSAFISKHPGGKFVIKSNAGKEVTKHFDYHSKRSQIIWEKYLIGEITKSGSCNCLS
tara:strand:+ start:98 stop:352 length:255 start_codon:yes stop_codon:yes gene_type:complete